ncbi:MAG: ACT domain-containing protein [Oscillospiraceae bacterium]|nr:ACT domain-containing protein [Oscillospiraceae bacterium]
MSDEDLLLVRRSVLPDVVLKVLEAKRLLAVGDEKSHTAVCRRVGISRSAFYKYKDCVFSYEKERKPDILSIYAVLKDEPGVLSSLLSVIHSQGANVMTLNQSVPVNGAAAVTLTLKFTEYDSGHITEQLSEVPGVVELKIIM